MCQCLKEKFNWLILLTGFLSSYLIFYQFLFRQGFWLDEFFVADNLVSRGFIDLLKPLDKIQVAPIMFLWIEKALLVMADIINKDWSDQFLRVYPLLCGLGVVLLYYKLVLKLTDSNKYIALMAYALLVLNPKFLYYTSEVKQYLFELFYSLLLIYVWLKKSEEGWTIKNTLWFLLFVLLAICNSFTICFVLLPMGLYDGWQLLKKHDWKIKNLVKSKDTLFYIFKYAVSLSFLIGYYFLFLRNHPSTFFMRSYWDVNMANNENWWNLLSQPFSWFFPGLNMQICILGVLTFLTFKKKQAFVLFLFIMLGHLIFSFFKIYPLYGRLVLYWMVFFPICVASVLYFLFNYCIKLEKFFKNYIFVTAFCFFVVYFFFVRLKNMPVYLYHAGYPKEVYSIIKKDLRKKDVIITEWFFPPHEYLNKYYIDVEDKLFDIQDGIWRNFLRGAIRKLDLLSKSSKAPTRAWIIPGLTKLDEVIEEFNKYDLGTLSNFELVFCKKTEALVYCLLERDPNSAIARIDFNTQYTEQKQFQVFVKEHKLGEESWMPEYKLRGFTFQKGGTNGSVKVRALNDTDIKLVLKGPWLDPFRRSSESWVDYTSVTINGEEILSGITSVSHNKPSNYTIHAKKGEEYIINASWKKHESEEKNQKGENAQ